MGDRNAPQGRHPGEMRKRRSSIGIVLTEEMSDFDFGYVDDRDIEQYLCGQAGVPRPTDRRTSSLGIVERDEMPDFDGFVDYADMEQFLSPQPAWDTQYGEDLDESLELMPDAEMSELEDCEYTDFELQNMLQVQDTYGDGLDESLELMPETDMAGLDECGQYTDSELQNMLQFQRRIRTPSPDLRLPIPLQAPPPPPQFSPMNFPMLARQTRRKRQDLSREQQLPPELLGHTSPPQYTEQSPQYGGEVYPEDNMDPAAECYDVQPSSPYYEGGDGIDDSLERDPVDEYFSLGMPRIRLGTRKVSFGVMEPPSEDCLMEQETVNAMNEEARRRFRPTEENSMYVHQLLPRGVIGELDQPDLQNYMAVQFLQSNQPDRYQRWIPSVRSPPPDRVSHIPSPEFPWMHRFFRTQVASSSTAVPPPEMPGARYVSPVRLDQVRSRYPAQRPCPQGPSTSTAPQRSQYKQGSPTPNRQENALASRAPTSTTSYMQSEAGLSECSDGDWESLSPSPPRSTRSRSDPKLSGKTRAQKRGKVGKTMSSYILPSRAKTPLQLQQEQTPVREPVHQPCPPPLHQPCPPPFQQPCPPPLQQPCPPPVQQPCPPPLQQPCSPPLQQPYPSTLQQPCSGPVYSRQPSPPTVQPTLQTPSTSTTLFTTVEQGPSGEIRKKEVRFIEEVSQSESLSPREQRIREVSSRLCKYGTMLKPPRTASTYRPPKEEYTPPPKPQRPPTGRAFGPFGPWVYGSCRQPPKTSAGRIAYPLEPPRSTSPVTSSPVKYSPKPVSSGAATCIPTSQRAIARPDPTTNTMSTPQRGLPSRAMHSSRTPSSTTRIPAFQRGPCPSDVPSPGAPPPAATSTPQRALSPRAVTSSSRIPSTAKRIPTCPSAVPSSRLPAPTATSTPQRGLLPRGMHSSRIPSSTTRIPTCPTPSSQWGPSPRTIQAPRVTSRAASIPRPSTSQRGPSPGSGLSRRMAPTAASSLSNFQRCPPSGTTRSTGEDNKSRSPPLDPIRSDAYHTTRTQCLEQRLQDTCERIRKIECKLFAPLEVDCEISPPSVSPEVKEQIRKSFSIIKNSVERLYSVVHKRMKSCESSPYEKKGQWQRNMGHYSF